MPDLTSLSARDAVLVSSIDALHTDAVLIEARRDAADRPPVIPAAHIAVLDRDLAGPSTPEGGRFPLPDADALAPTLARWGIDRASSVVVAASDPDDPAVATRAWFVLRAAGVRDVRVLDGGVVAWRESRDTDAAAPAPALGEAVRTLDAAAAGAVATTGVLIDARPAPAFDKGRIPGAVSAPASELFRDGRLLDDDELRAWAAGLGVTDGVEVGAYCGGGVAASGTVFALAALGIDAALYVGSWSAWSADPASPVER